MHEVLVYHLGGLNLPRKSVVRLTDSPYMTLDVYHGRKTTIQQQQPIQDGGTVAPAHITKMATMPIYMYGKNLKIFSRTTGPIAYRSNLI